MPKEVYSSATTGTTWNKPSLLSQIITVKIWGPGGGATNGPDGGGGGFAQCDIDVTSISSLTVVVGSGGTGGTTGAGAGGGGFSAVKNGSTYLAVAGGGGGAGGGTGGGAGGAGGGGTGGTGGNGTGGSGPGNGGAGGGANNGGAGGTGGSTASDGEQGDTDGTRYGGDGGNATTDATTGGGLAGGAGDAADQGGAGGSTTGSDGGGGGGGAGHHGGGGGEGSSGSGSRMGGGGGGGSNGFDASVTNLVTTQASGATAANPNDVDRPSNAGSGGTGAGSNGNDGAVVFLSVGADEGKRFDFQNPTLRPNVLQQQTQVNLLTTTLASAPANPPNKVLPFPNPESARRTQQPINSYRRLYVPETFVVRAASVVARTDHKRDYQSQSPINLLTTTLATSSTNPFLPPEWLNPIATSRLDTDHIWSINLNLLGQDQFFTVPGQGPSYDYLNPRGLTPQQPTQTPNIILGGLVIPFTQSVCVNPAAPISLNRGYAVGPNLNLIGQDTFFAAVGQGPSYDHPNPCRTRVTQPGQLSNPTALSLVTAIPFNQTDWPNPAVIRTLNVGAVYSTNTLLIGQDEFFYGVGRGPTYLHPNPQPADQPQHIVSVSNLALTTVLVTVDTFRSTEWPNPSGPRWLPQPVHQGTRLAVLTEYLSQPPQFVSTTFRWPSAQQPHQSPNLLTGTLFTAPTIPPGMQLIGGIQGQTQSGMWETFPNLTLGTLFVTPTIPTARQTDFPNPRFNRNLELGQVESPLTYDDSDELLGQLRRIYDLPVYARPQTRVDPVYNLVITSQVMMQDPFHQVDWTNPVLRKEDRQPENPDNLLLGTLFAGKPFLQNEWALPWATKVGVQSGPFTNLTTTLVSKPFVQGDFPNPTPTRSVQQPATQDNILLDTLFAGLPANQDERPNPPLPRWPLFVQHVPNTLVDLLQTPNPKPFLQGDWPNPSWPKQPSENKGYVTGTELNLVGKDQFFTEAGRGPCYEHHNPVLRTPIRQADCQRGHLVLDFGTPFAQNDWRNPRGHARLFTGDPHGSINVTLLAATPFVQHQWPVPIGPLQPQQPRNLPTVLPGQVGSPFAQTTWTNPAGKPPTPQDFTAGAVVRFLGQDTFFHGTGRGPNYDHPNPQLPRHPLENKGYVRGLNLGLVGKDTFFTDPGRGPNYDHPNPILPRYPQENRGLVRGVNRSLNLIVPVVGYHYRGGMSLGNAYLLEMTKSNHYVLEMSIVATENNIRSFYGERITMTFVDPDENDWTGVNLTYRLRQGSFSGTVLIEKSIGSGITLPNPDPLEGETWTAGTAARVIVTGPEMRLTPGTYYHTLYDPDTGEESMLSFGTHSVRRPRVGN